MGLYITLLVVAIALMMMIRTCSSPRPDGSVDPARQPAGGDTLNVAIEFAPMAMMPQGDTIAGFGYELLNAIAAREGLKVKFFPITSLSSTLSQMADGRFDLVIAEIPVTAEFKERYRFTEPVCLDRQVLVQRRDSTGRLPVNTQLQLGGRRVTVIAGSPAIDRLRNLAREIGDTIIICPDSIYSSEQLFLLVATGRIPLTVINRATAASLAADYPDVDISRGVSFTQFQSWIVSKSRPDLARRLDSAIVSFRADTAYTRLLTRYGLSGVGQ